MSLVPSVLFVCLGNICRSPMAEGLFRHRLRAAGVLAETDSAGTGSWHAGESADPRTTAVLARRGAAFNHVARQVVDDDFRRWDLILAMDRANLGHLRARAPAEAHGKLRLVLDPVGGRDVPDPWSGGPADFDRVARLLDEGLDAWWRQWAGG